MPFKTKGVKQSEIQKCRLCKKGVAHSNQLLSTRLRVTRLCVDPDAIRQQHGLEMVLGGNGVIAMALGTDREMLKPLGEEVTVMICDVCAMDMTLAELWELANEEKSDERPAAV